MLRADGRIDKQNQINSLFFLQFRKKIRKTIDWCSETNENPYWSIIKLYDFLNVFFEKYALYNHIEITTSSKNTGQSYIPFFQQVTIVSSFIIGFKNLVGWEQKKSNFKKSLSKFNKSVLIFCELWLLTKISFVCQNTFLMLNWNWTMAENKWDENDDCK